MTKKDFLRNLSIVEDLDCVKAASRDVSFHKPIVSPEEMPVPIHCLPIDKEWKNSSKTKWWSTNYRGPVNKEMLSMYKLREKLLSFGGEDVCMVDYEEDLDNILKFGQFWYGNDVIMKKGKPSQCHSNSAYLWDVNRDKTLITTGYALSSDGMWRQHSWCIYFKARSNRIVETTEKRIAYFGFVMPYKMSEQFYFDNE